MLTDTFVRNYESLLKANTPKPQERVSGAQINALAHLIELKTGQVCTDRHFALHTINDLTYIALGGTPEFPTNSATRLIMPIETTFWRDHYRQTLVNLAFERVYQGSI